MKSSLASSSSVFAAGRHAGVRLAIVYLPITEIRLPGRAVREHPRRQIRALARSLRDFGALIPAVVDREGVVFVGAAVVEAAREIGMAEFPTIRVTHLSDEELRLFRIAHSKLAEGGRWNLDALRIEFAEISLARPDLDLGTSGFQIAERDIIYGRHRTDELADLDDRVTLPGEGSSVSRLGDVLQLGRHRLVCGDATDRAVLAQAVDGETVRTVVSDLPYNVKINGNAAGIHSKRYSEFQQASGEMSREQFTAFLASAIGAMQPHLIDGALLYLFMDWRHQIELITAAEQCGLDQLNLVIWAKTNAGMGSFYRSAHEMVGVFKHGEAAHTNNVDLGRHGRNRTNVVHMPGVNSFGKGRGKALDLHPTVKPVALIADFILDASGPGEWILDPFGGSGTTLIAADKIDRAAALVELDPQYVDVICRRYEAYAGEPAKHVETGLAFDDLAASREGGE